MKEKKRDQKVYLKKHWRTERMMESGVKHQPVDSDNPANNLVGVEI